MKLPTKYTWLWKEPGPRMLVEALRLYGVEETAGAGNTPAIMGWAREIGGNVEKVYTADSIPWCGLFMSVVALRAGKSECMQPLWARAWASWGAAVKVPKLGDVLVYQRPTGGHVGLYVGEDATAYHTLGGNQGDAVSIVRIAKSRLIACRNEYAIGAPANVRRVHMTGGGHVSKNEA
jgi:uncharacterized protein (TIGR02594 family)